MNELAYRVGFGRRLAASLLDFLILGIVIVIVFQANGFFSSYINFVQSIAENPSNRELMQELQKQFMSDNMTNFYFANLLSIVYSSLEILIGASLGKLILGIQIAKADRNKGNYTTLAYRFALKNLAMLFSVLWLATSSGVFNTLNVISSILLIVGFFFVLGQKRQAFHDMIAKTAVFRKTDVIDEQPEIKLI